jgi:hypothetical protein
MEEYVIAIAEIVRQFDVSTSAIFKALTRSYSS